jgi:hypothetical protein
MEPLRSAAAQLQFARVGTKAFLTAPSLPLRGAVLHEGRRSDLRHAPGPASGEPRCPCQRATASKQRRRNDARHRNKRHGANHRTAQQPHLIFYRLLLRECFRGLADETRRVLLLGRIARSRGMTLHSYQCTPRQSSCADAACGLPSVIRTKRNIRSAASADGMQQNMYTAATALPTAPGSVASPSPAMFATTPAIAAPNGPKRSRSGRKSVACTGNKSHCTLQSPASG